MDALWESTDCAYWISTDQSRIWKQTNKQSACAILYCLKPGKPNPIPSVWVYVNYCKPLTLFQCSWWSLGWKSWGHILSGQMWTPVCDAMGHTLISNDQPVLQGSVGCILQCQSQHHSQNLYLLLRVFTLTPYNSCHHFVLFTSGIW